MGQLVSKSGFARMNGWVPSYVSQLNKEGRLVLDASGKKRWMSRRPWRCSARPPTRRALVLATVMPANGSSATSCRPRFWPPQRKRLQTLTAAICHRRLRLPGGAGEKKETHLAGIAELEERKQLRQLVELSKVQLALTDNAAAMRAALERLPDRIAPVLAAESDPRRIYQLLDDEIGLVLDELAKIAERLPARLFGTR